MPRRSDDPYDEHGQDRRVPDEERQHWADMTPGATDEYCTTFGRRLTGAFHEKTSFDGVDDAITLDGMFDSVCTACGRDLAAQECCPACGDDQ